MVAQAKGVRGHLEKDELGVFEFRRTCASERATKL